MKYLRKTLELGFSATILSTLILTACGGGGGGVAATTAGTSVTLTPVKGKFEGNCAIVVSNTTGTTLYTGTPAINPISGTTTISLPAGATGPYLISVAGDTAGTCKYFNDDPANPRLITMLPTESLNALVFSNQIASGVAITSLTEMAYQAASAIRGGRLVGLNDQSPEIAQGIAAAVNLAGLTGVSAVLSIFTPPKTIPASGVLANDDMGRTLENIAHRDTKSPLNAVRFMALQAAEAAAPASAAQFQAARNALPMMTPNAQGVAYASQVAAATAGAALSVANAGVATAFLADITTTGLRQIWFGYVDPVNNVPASGSLIKATLANAVYTVTQTWNNLVAGAWTPANSGNWVLGNKGWIDSNTTPLSFAMNPDGTAKITQEGFGTRDEAVFKKDLTGTTFASAVAGNMMPNPIGMFGMFGGINANGQQVLDASGVPTAANIVPAGAFTAGAIAYNTVPAGMAAMYAFNLASGVGAASAVMPTSSVAVATQDIYEVSTNNNGGGNAPAVNTAGVALTALPAIGTPFCPNAWTYMQPGAVAGTYDLFSTTGTCAAPAVGAMSNQTLTAKMVVVNGVSIMELIAPATAFGPGYTQTLAVLNGKVYQGWKTAKGTQLFMGGNNTMANQAAATQLSKAVKLPLF